MNYKKELVVLAGNCFPVSSSTGSIAIEFCSFLKNDFHISIIEIEQYGFRFNGEKYNGYDVYSIINWRLKWSQKAKYKRDHSKGLKARLSNFSYQLSRLIGRLQSTFFYINNNKWYIKAAFKKINEIEKKHGVDALLSFSAPHESIIACNLYKKRNPKVLFVSYWGDLFSNGANNNVFLSKQKVRRIEQKLASYSDRILCTEENHPVLSNYSIDSSRVIPIPYMLNSNALKILSKRQMQPKTSSSRMINVVYMGAFYKQIRNPEYFLEVFYRLGNRCRVYLYSTGDCEKIIKKYEQKSSGNISIMEQIPKNQLSNVLLNADILINIENKLNNSNPAKVLELVSFCKPIIDFNYYDSTCEFLQKYPMCLNVNMNRNIDDNLKIIESFLEHCPKKQVKPNDVYQAYRKHTEKNISELVLSSFGLGDKK